MYPMREGTKGHGESRSANRRNAGGIMSTFYVICFMAMSFLLGALFMVYLTKLIGG